MTWKHAVSQYSMLAKIITSNKISVNVYTIPGFRLE